MAANSEPPIPFALAAWSSIFDHLRRHINHIDRIIKAIRGTARTIALEVIDAWSDGLILHEDLSPLIFHRHKLESLLDGLVDILHAIFKRMTPDILSRIAC